MNRLPMLRGLLLTAVLVTVLSGMTFAGESQGPQEQVLTGTHGVRIVVRAQGPYDAAVPLQIVCYFKHNPRGDKAQGAPVELDKRLGGVIAALRDRGEFAGDEQETLLLSVPAGTIKPRLLLLVGLGNEADLSLKTMERVGRTALRQAAQLGITQVAFAPLLRDQGNDKLAVGDVETAVIRGMLLAYETHKRLETEGLAKTYELQEWIVEAGPTFFSDTIKGVEVGIADAKKSSAERKSVPYRQK